MLTDSKTNHDGAVDANEARLNEEMPKWTEDIKERVTSLREDTDNLADLLKNPTIADEKEDPIALALALSHVALLTDATITTLKFFQSFELSFSYHQRHGRYVPSVSTSFAHAWSTTWRSWKRCACWFD